MDLEFFKPDCIVPLPFFTKWIGKLVMPYVMTFLLVIITLVTIREVKQKKAQALRENPDAAQEAPKQMSMWRGFLFTLALLIHVLNIFHLKVVLSTVDCNYCRKGVKCLDEFTLVECFNWDDPTWAKMAVISMLDFILFAGTWPMFLFWSIWQCWKIKNSNQPPGKKEWILNFTEFFINRFKGSLRGTRPRRAGSIGGKELMTRMQSIKMSPAEELAMWKEMHEESVANNINSEGEFITFAWELWVTLRKYTMVLSAKFTTVEPETGALVHIIVLVTFLVGTLHYKPYMDPVLNWIETFTLLMSLAVIISAMLLSYDRDRDHNATLYPAFYWINVGALYLGSIVCLMFGMYKIITCWVDMGDKVSQGMGEKTSPEDDETPAEPSVASLMQEVFQKKDSTGSKEAAVAPRPEVLSPRPLDDKSTSSTPQVEMINEKPERADKDPDPSIEAVSETPRPIDSDPDKTRVSDM
eukprot:gnl/MRDRNA2_/MRDRNA2_243927_c0_seq1.p1 gnl/MRDRNA2_/MRDRNA2_243927_c0~~gnl/MRDRNA2_/MRDRNA2_243927_c0_seq1.p1  ORF type:complete len:483 (+),score=90.14 gnl/MRDRNA2_/MRDRNA2_243927_c0_seq1:43-1449(+)